MTNCVYRAYDAHIGFDSYLDSFHPFHPGLYKVRRRYELIKFLTHGPRWRTMFTRGGIVPFLIHSLAAYEFGAKRLDRRSYRGKFHYAAQHALWTPAHHYADAQNGIQRAIIKWSIYKGLFGPDMTNVGIDLAPAIYLQWGASHAVARDEVPGGIPILAIFAK